MPGCKDFGPLQAVKRAVNLDAWQHSTGVWKLILLSQFVGIKRAAPRRVRPSADSHEDSSAGRFVALMGHGDIIPKRPRRIVIRGDGHGKPMRVSIAVTWSGDSPSTPMAPIAEPFQLFVHFDNRSLTVTLPPATLVPRNGPGA